MEEEIVMSLPYALPEGHRVERRNRALHEKPVAEQFTSKNESKRNYPKLNRTHKNLSCSRHLIYLLIYFLIAGVIVWVLKIPHRRASKENKKSEEMLKRAVFIMDEYGNPIEYYLVDQMRKNGHIVKFHLGYFVGSDGKILYDDEFFTCRDLSQTLPIRYLNDDYCDCTDGSDEPGTSACPNSTYLCMSQQAIPSSFVNDGVCDCCDGSDEYLTKNCPNKC